MLIYLVSLILASSKPVAVIQASRHGARAPALHFAWDKGEWPEGIGELTAEGMRQHYLNGVEFRRRYMTANSVISKDLNASQVYIRSTDVNRTIASAQAQLMGLFPDGPDIRKQNHRRAVPPIDVKGLGYIEWRMGSEALPNHFSPVPVHVVQAELDYLLLGFNPSICPAVVVGMQQAADGEDFKERVYHYETYVKPKIDKIFNASIEFLDVANYADVLITQKFHGYPWPHGINEELFKEMEGIYNCSLSLYFYNQSKYLASSEFYRTIIANFENVISGTVTQRWWHYSAHDATLVGFLSVIHGYNGWNPPFASTLIFELIDDASNYNVSIKYNDKVIKVPGCNELCTFSQFKQFSESWIISDIKTACLSTSNSFKSSSRLVFS